MKTLKIILFFKIFSSKQCFIEKRTEKLYTFQNIVTRAEGLKGIISKLSEIWYEIKAINQGFKIMKVQGP